MTASFSLAWTIYHSCILLPLDPLFSPKSVITQTRKDSHALDSLMFAMMPKTIPPGWLPQLPSGPRGISPCCVAKIAELTTSLQDDHKQPNCIQEGAWHHYYCKKSTDLPQDRKIIQDKKFALCWIKYITRKAREERGRGFARDMPYATGCIHEEGLQHAHQR